jgi:DNA repair exonuclease SbcCD nuclease subunit
MKIAITADWHLDAVTLGVLRYKDLTDALSEMLEIIAQEKVQAFVFMGDLCNPDRGARTLRAMTTASKVAKSLERMSVPSYWIPGNHDVVDSNEIITTLSPLSAFAEVFEKPEIVVPSKYTKLMFLPYMSKMVQDQLALNRWVEEECVLGSASGKKTLVMFSHSTSVEGAKDGTETSHMPRGKGQELPLAVLKRHGVMVFNGHYHTGQTTDSGVHIPGALGRFDFGEQANAPGFMIVEVEG